MSFFLFDRIAIQIRLDRLYIILSKVFSFHLNLLLWMICFYSINHSYLKKSDKGAVLEGWISISLDPHMKQIFFIALTYTATVLWPPLTFCNEIIQPNIKKRLIDISLPDPVQSNCKYECELMLQCVCVFSVRWDWRSCLPLRFAGVSCVEEGGESANMTECLRWAGPLPPQVKECRVACKDDCALTVWSKFSECAGCGSSRARRRSLAGKHRLRSTRRDGFIFTRGMIGSPRSSTLALIGKSPCKCALY